MPLTRVPKSPDLARVVQVLGGREVEEGASRGRPGGWVPAPPGGLPSARAVEGPFVVERPGAVELPGGAGAAGLSGVDAGGDRDGTTDGDLDGTSDGTRDDDLEDQLRRARRPSLVTVPVFLRSGRVSVSSSAVVAVLALVVALGCAFVLRILWAERAAEGETMVGVSASRGEPVATGGPVTPEVVSRSGPADPGSAEPAGAAGTVPAAGSPGAGAASQPELVVHVVGQVARPGLVRLRAGARVADAIEAAGGAKRGADLAVLNLARALVDGEQVFVPKPGETPPMASGGPAPGAAGTGAGGAGSATDMVNLNTADLAALDSLPGVGPVLAQRIMDWRTENGRFTSVEELGEVSGIGDKMLRELRPKVTV